MHKCINNSGSKCKSRQHIGVMQPISSAYVLQVFHLKTEKREAGSFIPIVESSIIVSLTCIYTHVKIHLCIHIYIYIYIYIFFLYNDLTEDCRKGMKLIVSKA